MISIVVIYIIINVYLQKRCSCFDYCTIDCGDGPGEHTLCIYPESGSIDKNDIAPKLKVEEKRKILEFHNKLRQKVALGRQSGQPPASDMMKLEWDEELETIAQRWSKQLKYENDKCRNSRTGEKVGQNIAFITSEQEFIEYMDEIQQILQYWDDEGNHLYRNDVAEFRSSSSIDRYIEHYTQMVWGSTTKIGCGISIENDDINLNRLYHYVLVCNYKIAGNVMNKSMYEIGDPCSKCPPKYFCSELYKGLCTNSDETVVLITKNSAPFVRSSKAHFQVLMGLYILDIFVFL